MQDLGLDLRCAQLIEPEAGEPEHLTKRLPGSLVGRRPNLLLVPAQPAIKELAEAFRLCVVEPAKLPAALGFDLEALSIPEARKRPAPISPSSIAPAHLIAAISLRRRPSSDRCHSYNRSPLRGPP